MKILGGSGIVLIMFILFIIDRDIGRDVLFEYPWQAGGQGVCLEHNFVVLMTLNLVCLCFAIMRSAVHQNHLARFKVKVTVQGQMW